MPTSEPSSVKRFLDRSREALFVLDPACLVPGATCLLAVLFPLIYQGRVSAALGWSPRVLGLGLMAYAMGFVCCALGGQLRRRVTRLLRPRAHFHARLRKLLQAHGLSTALDPPWTDGADSAFAGYTSARQLYRALRAELGRPGREVALRALRLREGLITCYDGLAVALLVWAVEFWMVPRYVSAWPTPWNASLVVGGVLGAVAFACWGESERQSKESSLEVVAALALELQTGSRPLALSGDPRGDG